MSYVNSRFSLDWTSINEDGYCVKSVHIRSFFWSVFSRIWNEYGEIQSISPYSVRMREKTVQKKLRIWTHFTQWVLQRRFRDPAKRLKATIFIKSSTLDVRKNFEYVSKYTSSTPPHTHVLSVTWRIKLKFVRANTDWTATSKSL